jgi:hypothetical protein
MDSARRIYIRLLQRSASNANLPDTPDGAFSGELIREGYLTGAARPNEHGVITNAVVTGITVKGRLFLEKLRVEQRERSWLGRAKKFGLVALGFVIGCLAPVITALFKLFFHVE